MGSAVTTATGRRVHVADWPSIPGRLPLTEDAVRRTLAIGDPAVRNLWITQSYADLAHRLLDVFGTEQTWCTFATWASDTAGISIRGQEIPALVEQLLGGAEQHVDAIVAAAHDRTSGLRRLGLATTLHPRRVQRLVTVAVQQVAASIADGNTLVYDELAPLFVRFLDAVARSGPEGPPVERLDAWLDDLGVPSADRARWIRVAFTHYASAVAAPPPLRAEHVLAGNIAAVLHEQQRLQPDIEAALDAGVLDVGAALEPLFHRAVPGPIRRRIADAVARDVASHVEHLWQHVATRLLMRLTLPTGDLHLDRDVPPLPDGRHFPEALASPTLPDLVELLGQWDATGGTGQGAGARDWADLAQRMTYIVNLFRSRQQLTALTVPPFSTAQLAWMVRGEVPPNL